MWVAIAILGGLFLGGLLLALGVFIGVAVTENTHERDARARGDAVDLEKE